MAALLAALPQLRTAPVALTTAAAAVSLSLTGAALGLSMQAYTLLGQSSAPSTSFGAAMATLTFARQLGGSCGSAAFGWLLLTIPDRQAALTIILSIAAAVAALALLLGPRDRDEPPSATRRRRKPSHRGSTLGGPPGAARQQPVSAAVPVNEPSSGHSPAPVASGVTPGRGVPGAPPVCLSRQGHHRRDLVAAPPAMLGPALFAPPDLSSESPVGCGSTRTVSPLSAAVTGWVAGILGRNSPSVDRSWSHGASVVVEVVDTTGTRWFVKRHGDRDRYLAEVGAYRAWVPALGDRAPRLRAANDALQSVILSAVPGRLSGSEGAVPGQAAGPVGERGLHRQAGVLLRRLHDAEPAAAWPDVAEVKAAELDRLVTAATGLLGRGDIDFVRAQVLSLGGLDAPLVQVACHLDYGPRNWLVDAEGTLRVIDFEWARRDLWVSDLARLYSGEWAGRPDLQEAFLDGYGRKLEQGDRAALHAVAALRALWLVIRARATGQADFEQANRELLGRLRATVDA